ncbi:MAG: M24 family metallopeptidase [Nanoarchaeota archaeon]
MENRKNFLKNLIKECKLDGILIYSSWNDAGCGLAFTGIIPIFFNYYFISKDSEVFLELDYLIEDLKNKTNVKVLPLKEDLPGESLKDLLKRCKKVGIIGNAPWRHFENLKIELVDLNDEVNNFVNVKDKKEIDKIKKVAQETLSCLKLLRNFIVPGKTRKDIADFLKLKLLEKGDALAFPTCVTSGEKIKETTASFPTDKKILKRDIVVVDAGLVKDGFYSDCTRMYFLNFPEAELNYNKLVKAHLKVISKVKPGIFVKDVLKFYNEELKKEGLPYETLEKEDLGHSIGFMLHEIPLLCQEKYLDFKLKDDMIITLEPEIVFDYYRLRVEDMILVKDKSEILTGA